MKSLNVLPVDSSCATIFGVDTSIFLLVKNMSGQIYSPYLGIGQITNVSTGQGYQVYCNVSDTIRPSGPSINVTFATIPMAVGWNMIAYFPQTSDSVQFALASIRSSLTLAKNNAGAVYMPSFGLNSIGRMQPGEGYKALMAAVAALTYPPGTDKAAAHGAKTVSLPSPRHYRASLNTGNNATVVMQKVAIGKETVPDGSEVGVFDGQGYLVGSGTVVNGMTALAVWGADPVAKKPAKGLADGAGMNFRLWTGAQEYPLDFTSGNGAPRYAADAVFMGEATVIVSQIKNFDLARVYPNPFRGNVKIAFDVPTTGGGLEIEISVYDMKGSLVQQLVKGTYMGGHYTVSWNGDLSRLEAFGSNVYVVRMRAGGFDKRLKLVRIR